jgi:hypothetical protein
LIPSSGPNCFSYVTLKATLKPAHRGRARGYVICPICDHDALMQG